MSMSTVESDILTRVVLPENATFSRAVAEGVLALKFTPGDIERMNALAEKAREGTLTPAEQGETESYERVANFLSLLKSKARMSLNAESGRS